MSAPAAVSFIAKMNIGREARSPGILRAARISATTGESPPDRLAWFIAPLSGSEEPGRAVPALDPHAAGAVQIDAVIPVAPLHRHETRAGSDAAVRGEGRFVGGAGEKVQGDGRAAVRAREADGRGERDRLVKLDVVAVVRRVVEVVDLQLPAGGVEAEATGAVPAERLDPRQLHEL